MARNKELHEKVKALDEKQLAWVLHRGGYYDCKIDTILSVVTKENSTRVRVVFKDDGSFESSSIKARTGYVFVTEKDGKLIGDF